TLNILLAKVKAILGRYERMTEAASAAPVRAVKEVSGRISITDDMYLDTASHSLQKNDSVISLKAMEYKMLLYLVNNKNRVITKDEFLKNVWEDDYVGEGTLAVHVRHLREKTEKDPNAPDLIKTVWGVGYILETGADQ
ncbi:MAG: response regulator transcription factor, partial [Oscillospiraceae bacterium]|nr:response regulator transcription factor [Oscillospiraceae bacterium]